MRSPASPCRALLALLIFCPSAFAFAQQTQPADSTARFVRFTPDTRGGGVLETSTVRYQNADGVVLDLVAAIHVADAPYYRAIDSSFADYDHVLFESVRDDPNNPAQQSWGIKFVGLSQVALTKMLALTYQKDGINYKRPNFVHADMDLATFQKRLDERGETLFGSLSKSAPRDPKSRKAQQDAASSLFGALASSPQEKSRKMKLAMAKLLAAAEFMGTDQDSVIITERNAVALGVLKKQLAAGDKTLAIFYGGGHLRAMDKTLTQKMGFKQVGPPIWRVAWDMSTATPTTNPTTRAATRPAEPVRG